MANSYMQVIQELRNELTQKIEQREHSDKRIAELRGALRALVPFAEEPDRLGILKELKEAERSRPPSLPDAVLDILCKAAKKLEDLEDTNDGLNANQIREQLERSGFDIEEYSQPLGAVLTAAHRLVESKQLSREKTSSSGVVFRPKQEAMVEKIKAGRPDVHFVVTHRGDKVVMQGKGKLLWPEIEIGPQGGIGMPGIRTYDESKKSVFEWALEGDLLLKKQNERDAKRNK